jgi:hypothetical protein
MRWYSAKGCLIGVVLICCGTLEARAQAPEGPGVAQGGPTPGTQADREAAQTDEGIEQEQFSIPVRILEEPEDPEETERREQKERRSEEREQADLEAQRSMAESARELLRPTWWQVGIAGIGALLLGASLGFSAWAAKAAADAAKAAQQVLKAERAWLTYETIETGHHGDPTVRSTTQEREIIFKIVWKNSGRTPALRTHMSADIRLVDSGKDIPVFEKRPRRAGHAGGVIGPGISGTSVPASVFGEGVDRLISQKSRVYLYSRATYEDVFNPNTIRESEACVCITYFAMSLENGRSVPEFTMETVGHQNGAT